MLRKIKLLLLITISLFLFITPQTFAQQSDSFVTPVFPVRGHEFWPLSDSGQNPYTNFQHYRDLIRDNNLAATWLFRYDALQDNQITSTAKLLPNNQQNGIFLEITPSLATAAQVEYPDGDGWSSANRVFISGYSLDDRKKIINTVISSFLKLYGHFPRTVGAWHIDAWSANYLSQHYGINSIIIVADQFATDRYQLWGGWWGVPYYPSKNSILTPAQSLNYKLPVTVAHWASRDPALGYGGSVHQSIYSVQANDYMLLNLDTNYFEQLLQSYTQNPDNQFGYLLIGIENDYDVNQYGQEVANQLALIKKYQDQAKIQSSTIEQFSHWYQQKFPQLSPNHTIASSHNETTTTWEMTPQYRLTWTQGTNSESHSRESAINPHKPKSQTTKNLTYKVLDYRAYNQKYPEPYLETQNQFPNLHLVVPSQIDTIIFPEQAKTITQTELEQLRHPAAPKLPFQTNYPAILIWYLFLSVILIYLTKSTLLNFRASLLLTVGSLTISLPMLKSGLLYPYGMGFWGPNGHDGIWHLSLVEHFTRNLNLDSPILADVQLSNYHFLFDWILALINKLTLELHRLVHVPEISSITLYFQIIPPLMAILLGILTWKFMLTWTKSETAGYLSLILIYFGGGLGWLVNLFRGRPLGGESMFWSTQSISTLINPPFTLSLILFLTGLLLVNQYINRTNEQMNNKTKHHRKISPLERDLDDLNARIQIIKRGVLTTHKNKFLLITTSAIFGLLVHAKSYAGILALASLSILSIREIITKFKITTLLSLHYNRNTTELREAKYPITQLLIVSSIISLITLLPVTKLTGQSFFEWNPLWFPRTMLLFEDRFHWPQLYGAIQAYWATGNWIKGILADGLAIAIFYAGNLGIRIIGAWAIYKAIQKTVFPFLLKKGNKGKFDNITLKQDNNETLTTCLLLLITLLSAIIPLFLTQTGTPWNTIQFLYYTLFFMSLLTAKVISEWLKNLKAKLSAKSLAFKTITAFTFVSIVLFNLPTTIGTLKHYLPYRAPSRTPYEELSALEFLRGQPPGRVLTYPFDQNKVTQYETPKPLANYVSTAYVSALSTHPVYLEDEINLDITGAPWREARQKATQFFLTLNESTARDFLNKNQIQYLYLLKGQQPNLPPEQLDFERIFDNGLTKIYTNTSPDYKKESKPSKQSLHNNLSS